MFLRNENIMLKSGKRNNIDRKKIVPKPNLVPIYPAKIGETTSAILAAVKLSPLISPALLTLEKSSISISMAKARTGIRACCSIKAKMVRKAIWL